MTPIEQLMLQWANIEPTRCWQDEPREWVYRFSLGQSNYLFNTKHPTEQQLMWLEFAVRESATSKDKTILIRRGPDNMWRGMVDAASEYDAEPAIALLKAYLQLLTWEQNQAEEAIA